MKAGSLLDDDAVALRESRASPSLGEVCPEVCSRYVSLCLHLFFSIFIKLLEYQSECPRMKTCYFDRNIFDQIDKKRDVTEGDIVFLRNEITNNHIQVLVSFETVQETTYAKRETAL